MNITLEKQKRIVSQPVSKGVATWLLIGVGMIVIQVLIGGITRLTESGLSITEWKPITGMLPPMNEASWMVEFEKYKGTDQFKYVHQNFTLSEFKTIFFWEWFHRVWARLLGIVFLVGFVYFIIRRKLKKEMILPLLVLFGLGAVQGLIGWLMVKSGLVPEKYFVGHVELATHFIAAMGLLAYTLWFALQLSVPSRLLVIDHSIRKLIVSLLIVLSLQLIFGAFMAGMHAAITAPTWPDINGKMIPANITELQPFSKNIVYNPLMVHFIHRGLAYLLLLMTGIWWFKTRSMVGNRFFRLLKSSLVALVTIQVVLGIATVLNATVGQRLVVLGVLHQFTAMILVMVLVALLYIVRKRSPAALRL